VHTMGFGSGRTWGGVLDDVVEHWVRAGRAMEFSDDQGAAGRTAARASSSPGRSCSFRSPVVTIGPALGDARALNGLSSAPRSSSLSAPGQPASETDSAYRARRGNLI
jgi:hypothetical protein